MINFDCMIGNVRVTRVEEDVRPSARPEDWFIDYDVDELAAHMPGLLPKYFAPHLGRMISSVHTWVLRTPTRTILIDTCTGNHKERPGWPIFNMLETRYLDRLREAEVDPKRVDLVLCTHLHVDHVGWNTQLDNGRWIPTFPNAKYLMSRRDHEHFASATTQERNAVSRHVYQDSILPVVEAGLATFVEGDERLDRDIRLLPAPGHTPGQVRLDLQSGRRIACFCGDVLHHPLQVPLWKWRTKVCVDPDQARDTRRKVLESCADSGALMLPAHFAHPHGGYVDRVGDDFSLIWPQTPGAERNPTLV